MLKKIKTSNYGGLFFILARSFFATIFILIKERPCRKGYVHGKTIEIPSREAHGKHLQVFRHGSISLITRVWAFKKPIPIKVKSIYIGFIIKKFRILNIIKPGKKQLCVLLAHFGYVFAYHIKLDIDQIAFGSLFSQAVLKV